MGLVKLTRETIGPRTEVKKICDGTRKMRAILIFSFLSCGIDNACTATSKPLGLRCDEVGDFGLAAQVEVANNLLLQTIGVRNALVLA